MKTILVEKISKIIKNRRELEKKLNIKISNRGKEVKIEGSPEDEYIAGKIIDAISFGFKIPEALTILKGAELEIINIKDYSKNRNLERIRARLIGKKGRVLDTLRKLSDSFIEANENKIGIISDPEELENITQAIVSIIQGSKQSHAYNFLEKNKPEPIYDLGLKEKPLNKKNISKS